MLMIEQFISSIIAGIEGRPLGTPPNSTTAVPKPSPVTPVTPSVRVNNTTASTSTAVKAGTTNLNTVSTGMKRKADDAIDSKPAKTPKSITKVAAHASSSRTRTMTPKTTNTITPQSSIASLLTPDPSKPPPKKGSFAEIMARGQAMQEKGYHVGEIKHCPAEKKYGPERRAEKRAMMADRIVQKKKAAADRRLLAKRVRALNSSSDTDVAPRKREVKKVDIGYKGTARAQPAKPEEKSTAKVSKADLGYKGTARAATRSTSAEVARGAATTTAGRRPNRRVVSSEEEDDVDTDASSDMEAAAFEVEQEEYKSLKRAQLEDEEALREEMALKSQKEQKKRALEALAAKRR